MKHHSSARHRLFIFGSAVVLIAVALWGLAWIDEQMTVRYQAVGRIMDAGGKPADDVEVLLLLSPPPPAGPQLDELFDTDGERHGRYGRNGEIRRELGPIIGLTGGKGYFVVRVVGRTGAARAIRMGFDTQGRPPFETAWLVMRQEGRPDVTKSLSILGWRPSPKEWGVFANRLPVMHLE